MHATPEDITAFRRQLEQGSLQQAYRAILSFMAGLRTVFVNTYGDAQVSALYQGYMDMNYFALFPPSLKQRGLKAAIVFNYDRFQFEAWLAARNRTLQRQYWELFKNSQWDEYRVVEPAPGIDAIIECTLASGFDPADPPALTARIETAAVQFIEHMEQFLSGQPLL